MAYPTQVNKRKEEENLGKDKTKKLNEIHTTQLIIVTLQNLSLAAKHKYMCIIYISICTPMHKVLQETYLLSFTVFLRCLLLNVRHTYP